MVKNKTIDKALVININYIQDVYFTSCKTLAFVHFYKFHFSFVVYLSCLEDQNCCGAYSAFYDQYVKKFSSVVSLPDIVSGKLIDTHPTF